VTNQQGKNQVSQGKAKGGRIHSKLKGGNVQRGVQHNWGFLHDAKSMPGIISQAGGRSAVSMKLKGTVHFRGNRETGGKV